MSWKRPSSSVLALVFALQGACSTSDSPEESPGADGAEDGADGMETPPGSLPEGSRVVGDVLNLVDAEATRQLESMLSDLTPTHVASRRSLTRAANTFLSVYRDEYDFLYFFLDHGLPDAGAYGAFEAVNRPARAGGTSVIQLEGAGYRSEGRLRGVAGFQYYEGVYPPLGHETAHYWANDLDLDFGFGASTEGHYGPHWGYSSVYGQLGGFDAATLRCAAPAGTIDLAACEPESDGSVQYVVGNFGPFVNSGNAYGPLELYLMGLVPAAEVPSPLLLLDGASTVPDSYDEATDTKRVRASGLRELPLSDIIARHGPKAPLPEAERAFRAALVVVSATPASDAVMGDIARWGAVFDGRTEASSLPSFSFMTGGRASMDTRLGSEREAGDSVPAPRDYRACDLLAQDCEGPELGCYASGPRVCALSGQVAENGACASSFQCAPGLDCLASEDAPDKPVCKPYCDFESLDAANGCAKLCGASGSLRVTRDGEVIAAVCLPD